MKVTACEWALQETRAMREAAAEMRIFANLQQLRARAMLKRFSEAERKRHQIQLCSIWVARRSAHPVAHGPLERAQQQLAVAREMRRLASDMIAITSRIGAKRRQADMPPLSIGELVEQFRGSNAEALYWARMARAQAARKGAGPLPLGDMRVPMTDELGTQMRAGFPSLPHF